MANKLFSFFKQGNDTYEVKDAAARAAISGMELKSVPITTNSRMSSYGGVKELVDGSLAKGFIPYIIDETSSNNYIPLCTCSTTQARFAGVNIGTERYLAISADSAPIYKDRFMHTAAETDIDVSTHTLKLYYK